MNRLIIWYNKNAMPPDTHPSADKSALRTFDARTEKLIKTLCPRAQEQARVHLAACRSHGIDARIISGTRSASEQDALYAQGRTKPGKIVTNALAWYSNHNYKIAYDIGVFDSHGNYLEDSPLYAKAGALGVALGLEWGGAWTSLQDEPHFQCRTGQTVDQLRALVTGKGFDLQKATPAIDALIKPLKAQSVPETPKPWSVTVNGKSLSGVFRDGAGTTLVPVRLFVQLLKGDERAKNIKSLDNVLYEGFNRVDEPDGDPVKTIIVNGTAFCSVRSLCDAFGGTIAPLGTGDMAHVVVVTG